MSNKEFLFFYFGDLFFLGDEADTAVNDGLIGSTFSTFFKRLYTLRVSVVLWKNGQKSCRQFRFSSHL